jgi:hypothetical protein
VVLHAVPAAHDLAAKLRMLRATRGDREEGGAHRMRIEQVEDRGRDFGVGTVVDRDRDFAARRSGVGQARPVAAQPVRGAARAPRR